MATKIMLEHKETKLTKNGYYGYSWTFLLFGGFVPLIRGQLVHGVLHLLATILLPIIWNIIFSFLYNKQYMSKMILEGWSLTGSDAEIKAAELKLGIRSDE